MDETKAINREEQIFLGALELGPNADVDKYLQNECHGDDELRIRVEELLNYHQRIDNILDETSAGLLGGSKPDADSIGVGTQIGPYKLLQQIGIGGMGVVFMAEQNEPVRRKVAIKIIKLGMDTRNVIARFEAERQALAIMDHPNITKVFDAGISTTGRPYFVMELVTGLTITDYCDRERLSLRDRIKLFCQVCVGVKHAHQKGIIHRDLKPSNVMVTHYDGDAVPKIIDFGIAKAVDQSLTEKTLFTSYGNMIGTPEYMSPEQAEMSGQDIDTRSDVYSLGVLLYELLTGTTPFYHWNNKGVHKICDAICNEEPELASTRVNNLADTVNEISRNRGTDVQSLRRFLRGEMDWILAKCISKNRNDRYESAADLARDVQNYLDGQPVAAVGPKFSYRARKFINKHRAIMSSAAVFLVAMCAATVISTAFALKATEAQKLANKLRIEAEQERKVAEIERDRARAAETKLKQLERRSRNEAAAARAIAKFNRPFSNSKAVVGNLKQPSGFAIWSDNKHKPNPGTKQAKVTTVHQIHSDDSAKPQIIETGNIFFHGNEHGKEVLHVVIKDQGMLEITSPEIEAAEKIRSNLPLDVEHPHVIIRGERAADDTKRFLKLLVEEQRKSFGPDDDVVANTLIKIGDVSLDHQEWSHAENHFREARDILKRRSDIDEKLVKLELLLSKALVNQQKTTAAKQTMANTVNHLKKLRDVPDEVVEVIVDLKREAKDLDFELHELNDSLPEQLKKRLKMKLDLVVEEKHPQKSSNKPIKK